MLTQTIHHDSPSAAQPPLKRVKHISCESKAIPSGVALYKGHPLWDPSWVEGQGESTLRTRSCVGEEDEHSFDFILYSSWFCPFAQRAWIAAEESGASYKWVEINPYQVDAAKPGGYTKIALPLEEKKRLMPEFMQASPRGLVPALRIDAAGQDKKNILLWESLPIAEYIDSMFGGSKLIKRDDPYEVARQQIWCAHCTERVQRQYYKALVAQDKEKEQDAIEEFYQECRALARAMRDDGPYFDGKDFSLVDVALAPFWQRFITVGPHYFGLTFPTEEPEFQRLDKWWQAVSARPSVAATIVCEARLLTSYSDYSKGIATSDSARNYFK